MNYADEKAALYKAIMDHPADDLPRLAYADFLMESGDDVQQAHGEFVQVQVEIAKLEAQEATPARDISLLRLSQWEKELLKGPAGQWRREAESWKPPVEITCRRGFTWRVRCPWDVWRDMGWRIIAAHPVEVVGLSDREPRQREDGRFLWHRSSMPPRGAGLGPLLPDDLFNCLAPDAGSAAEIGFDTLENALAAISAACLKYARLPKVKPVSMSGARPQMSAPLPPNNHGFGNV